MKWRCEVCGYIHTGDNPPEICPVCGVDAGNFTRIAEPGTDPQKEVPSWRCTVCGYIHEGEKPPEACPICGVDAGNFEKITAAKPEKAPVQQPAVKLSPEEALKTAVRSFSYGLFIITASFAGKDNGQTANTSFQITSEPVQVAIGINKNNYTHELIKASGKFGVSVLDQNGQDLARNFGYRSGRDADKFQGIKAHRGTLGMLLPDEVLATLEAEVVGTLDAGTHTLFLGKVVTAEVLNQGEPMTYAYFRSKK
jgi:flavin reductase (DIM6/NTAB) family NADH-FMN oxidoreductase RutF/rubredoxin